MEKEVDTQADGIASFKAFVNSNSELFLTEDGYDTDEVYDENETSRSSDMPDILKVRGVSGSEKGYVMRLSKSILTSIAKYNYAELQAIGAAAVNNMMKAFIKAKSATQDHVNGYCLVNQACFCRVRINGEITTAIRMKVFGIPTKLVP